MKQINRRVLVAAMLGLVGLCIVLLFSARESFRQSSTAEKSVPVVAALVATPGESPTRPILSGMGAQELLTLAEELASAGHLDATTTREIAPYLARQSRSSLQPRDVIDIVADASRPWELRAFLVDFLIHSADLTREERNGLTQILLHIAESSDAAPQLRRYAVLALRGEQSDATNGRLHDIVDDEDSPSEVRGAAITALRRSNAPSLPTMLDGFLGDPAATEPDILRHTVVATAKSGLAADRIPDLRNLALTTRNSEVYASTIYALGLTDSPAAVQAIVDAADRFESEQHIVSYALGRSRATVLAMLEGNRPESMVRLGISAARFGRIAEAHSALASIERQHSDPSIRALATAALAESGFTADSETLDLDDKGE